MVVLVAVVVLGLAAAAAGFVWHRRRQADAAQPGAAGPLHRNEVFRDDSVAMVSNPLSTPAQRARVANAGQQQPGAGPGDARVGAYGHATDPAPADSPRPITVVSGRAEQAAAVELAANPMYELGGANAAYEPADGHAPGVQGGDESGWPGPVPRAPDTAYDKLSQEGRAHAYDKLSQEGRARAITVQYAEYAGSAAPAGLAIEYAEPNAIEATASGPHRIVAQGSTKYENEELPGPAGYEECAPSWANPSPSVPGHSYSTGPGVSPGYSGYVDPSRTQREVVYHEPEPPASSVPGHFYSTGSGAGAAGAGYARAQ